MDIPGDVWSMDCGGDCFSCTEGTMEERLEEVIAENIGNSKIQETAHLAIREIKKLELALDNKREAINIILKHFEAVLLELQKQS